MKAIILAAGEGSRLRPYTLDRPKCLVEVDGRSLLDRQLDVLTLGNINPIMLIGGYRAEMLPREGIELRINSLYAETNMVWTLFCEETDLVGDLIVSYKDKAKKENRFKKYVLKFTPRFDTALFNNFKFANRNCTRVRKLPDYN